MTSSPPRCCCYAGRYRSVLPLLCAHVKGVVGRAHRLRSGDGGRDCCAQTGTPVLAEDLVGVRSEYLRGSASRADRQSLIRDAMPFWALACGVAIGIAGLLIWSGDYLPHTARKVLDFIAVWTMTLPAGVVIVLGLRWAADATGLRLLKDDWRLSDGGMAVLPASSAAVAVLIASAA